jgi:hypothetical protein
MSDYDINTIKLRELFNKTSAQVNLRGILGVTSYKPVYDQLLPVQKKCLNEITDHRHDEFTEKGYFISFAYVYPEGIVDNIGLLKDGVFDKNAWNIYSKWYTFLNKSLDITSEKIAEGFNGVPIKATSSGIVSKLTNVNQYFPTVVSHRVHAELSGIGWRGKNGLIINPKHSCMIRLSGVVSSVPLRKTQKSKENCETCISCLEVCTFLKHREILDDYREQCRIYINNLELDDEICGKCIKACVHSPKFNSKPRLTKEQSLNDIYYTER